MPLKHVHYLQDAQGRSTGPHDIRTKDGAEVDFALSEDNRLTHLIECKLADNAVHRSLAGFADRFPESEAIRLVRDLRQEAQRGGSG